MIAEETVNTVKELLKTSTLSQRQIARQLGINRETVGRIASGNRFDAAAEKRRRQATKPVPIEEPVRCGRCGQLVDLIPCQACQLRSHLRRSRRCRVYADPPPTSTAPLMGVDLRGETRDRYLEVRTAKIRRGERPLSNRCFLSDILFSGGKDMPVLKNIQYVRWFLAHVSELLPLLELPDQLRRAGTLAEKWQLIKAAGDTIVAVLEKFPVREVAQVVSYESLQAEVVAKGISWQKLLELLPLLVQLITLVRGGGES